MRWWVFGVWLSVGCGPAVGAASEAGSGTGGASAQTGSSETTTSPTSTGPATSGPSSSTSGSRGTSGKSSSTSGAPLDLVELEGPIHYCADCFNPMSYLRACESDEDWLCLIGNEEDLWRCNGTYARVRGYLIPNPDPAVVDGACGDFVIDVTEVLEARLCEPEDCGVGCSDGLDCEPTCWGPEGCERDEKCVPWALPGGPYGGRKCAPVDAEPVGPGGACATNPEAPWIDNCDADSLCFDGTCRLQCAPFVDGVSCGSEHCFSDVPGVAVCLPGCNPLEPDCPDLETCVGGLGNYACISPEGQSGLEEPDCDGNTCGPLELCIVEAALVDCPGPACCSGVCSLSAPDCAAGLVCTEFWSAADYPELTDVGVCLSPDAAKSFTESPVFTPE